VRLLALLAIAACGGDPAVSEPSDQPKPAPKPVAERPAVQRGYLGVLAPRESQDVVSPFTAQIAEVKVQLGDQVKHGQVLARFDERSLKQQLEAEVSTLSARDGEVSQAAIDVKSAQASLEKEKKALDEGVGLPSLVDQARLSVDKARAAVQSATGRRQEQRTKVETLRVKLKDATLLAPADGRVSYLFHRQGERVEEGQAVVQIVSNDDLYIKFAIPGDKVGTMARGDEVDVVVDNRNGNVKAIVRSVAPIVDSVSQMILAEADLAGPNDKLQGGQRCHVFPRPKKP
jgi:RND family efflux transporter MFP subunit